MLRQRLFFDRSVIEHALISQGHYVSIAIGIYSIICRPVWLLSDSWTQQ